MSEDKIHFSVKKSWLAAPLVLVLLVLIAAAAFFYYNHLPKTPKLPEPPLKELANKNHDLQIGNFAIPKRLNERPYKNILTSQFNFALVDNQPNWHFTDADLRPAPGKYNFSRIDEVVKFAERNKMPLQMHHYIWGEEKWLPDWLKNGNYSNDQLLDIMHDHIMAVGGRYQGRVREWSVVNEAFTRNSHMFGLRDWWADHTGGMDYIDKAFIWARQADPDSKLILNDFGNESQNDISDAMFNYIKTAKARGVPIDGIGMQMHIDGTHPPQKDEVIKNMKRFGQLGIAVYVTEFDVNMNDSHSNDKDRDQIEAGIYYEMARACIESEVCHSFAILGITDKETWYNYLGIPDARPLPFDENYQPKPAFYSFRNALEQK